MDLFYLLLDVEVFLLVLHAIRQAQQAFHVHLVHMGLQEVYAHLAQVVRLEELLELQALLSVKLAHLEFRVPLAHQKTLMSAQQDHTALAIGLHFLAMLESSVPQERNLFKITTHHVLQVCTVLQA